MKAMGSFDKGLSSYGLLVHDALLFVDFFFFFFFQNCPTLILEEMTVELLII